MTDTIDVWRIRPLRRAGDAATLKAVLPREDIARIERLGDPARERAAITSRAILRILLAHYTHVPANEIRLVPGMNGKPHLDAAQNPEQVTFNFSDSADMALVAVARNREVGVDVEKLRPVEHATELAIRYFPSQTAEELRAVGSEDRSRIFLQTWARHEALLKAKAGTIWNPAGDEVNLNFSDSQSYVQTGGLFTVTDLDTGLDYVGALAAQGEGWSVALKDYHD